MAVDAKSLTNQKLYFAQTQLAKLNAIKVNNNEQLEGQVCVDNGFLQLFFAYRALVLEIADHYGLGLSLPRIDLDAPYACLVGLEQALAENGFSSPELVYLQQLAKDEESWLNILLSRFKQTVNGELPADQLAKTSDREGSAKKIQLIELENKKNQPAGFFSELQLIYNELTGLVEELRASLQEY